MKIYKFIKTASLEERNHVLVNQIRDLGIKVLDTSLADHAYDSGKATQSRNVADPHSCFRPVFTDNYITGKYRNR